MDACGATAVMDKSNRHKFSCVLRSYGHNNAPTVTGSEETALVECAVAVTQVEHTPLPAGIQHTCSARHARSDELFYCIPNSGVTTPEH